jgi:hypothetical protein
MRPKTLRVVEGLDSIVDVQLRLAIRTAKILADVLSDVWVIFPPQIFQVNLRETGEHLGNNSHSSVRFYCLFAPRHSL